MKPIISGLVIHPYNPSTWEVEIQGSRVQGQPGLNETLSIKRKTNKQKNIVLDTKLKKKKEKTEIIQ